MKGSWTQEKIGGKPADLYFLAGRCETSFGLLYCILRPGNLG